MSSVLERYRKAMGATPAERVASAREAAGEAPALLGFDANGIQAMIGASKRPLAMRGASQLLTRFDDEVRCDRRTIFAGGGRALMVVSAAEADELGDRYRGLFRERTHGGVLAVATVPLGDDEEDALRRFRFAMGLAKDAAPPPSGDDLELNDEACPDCRRRAMSTTLHIGDGADPVCARCKALVETGRKTQGDDERGKSLEDLAESGRVAVISADGNDLGVFFQGLRTLEALSAGSFAVGEIVKRSHERALEAIDQSKTISPVTGGDDIRVLLPPSMVVPYVEAVMAAIEAEASQAGNMGGALSDTSAARLGQIRLGMGILVAPAHFSASRLLDAAHALEGQAKKRCRASTAKESGVAIRYITTGDSIDAKSGSEGQSSAHRAPTSKSVGDAPESDVRLRTEPVLWSEWSARLVQADKLAAIPPSQVGTTLRPKSDMRPAEADNLFRYQLARDRQGGWRAFIEALTGRPWTELESANLSRLDRTVLDLMRLQEHMRKAPR